MRNKKKEEQKKDEEKASFTPTFNLFGKKGSIMPNCPLAKNANQNQNKYKKL